MPRSALPIDQLLAALAATPPRLAALTAGRAPAQLRTPLAPEEWSATEVLAHLRACADVWGGCIAAMLAEDRPTLRAVDPRTWVTRTDYPTLEFQPSLDAFAAQRTALLAVLAPLTPADWARAATVTGAGAVLTRTVESYAQRLARHERPHVKQIARIAGTLRG